MPKPTYSIIAPIFNESGNIQELYRRLHEVLDSTGEDWELILVDDGSTDNSADLIRQYAVHANTRKEPGNDDFDRCCC